MSKHRVDGGDVAELLDRFAQIQEKARLPTGRSFPIVRIQEAELDGFWIHRVPEAYGIESYVVDAAAIATSRRRPRAKTDKIDGEALVRELLAFNRGVVVYAQLSKRRAHSTKIGGASAGRNG